MLDIYLLFYLKKELFFFLFVIWLRQKWFQQTLFKKFHFPSYRCVLLFFSWFVYILKMCSTSQSVFLTTRLLINLQQTGWDIIGHAV